MVVPAVKRWSIIYGAFRDIYRDDQLYLVMSEPGTIRLSMSYSWESKTLCIHQMWSKAGDCWAERMQVRPHAPSTEEISSRTSWSPKKRQMSATAIWREKVNRTRLIFGSEYLSSRDQEHTRARFRANRSRLTVILMVSSRYDARDTCIHALHGHLCISTACLPRGFLQGMPRELYCAERNWTISRVIFAPARSIASKGPLLALVQGSQAIIKAGRQSVQAKGRAGWGLYANAKDANSNRILIDVCC